MLVFPGAPDFPPLPPLSSPTGFNVRPASIAPSLELNFMTRNNDDIVGHSAIEVDPMSNWFDTRSSSSSTADREPDDEDDDVPIRSQSRIGLNDYNDQDEDDSEDFHIRLEAKQRTVPANRKSVLSYHSRANSLAGVLENFGIGASEFENETKVAEQAINGRAPLSATKEEDEDGASLADILSRRRGPINAPLPEQSMNNTIDLGGFETRKGGALDLLEDDMPLIFSASAAHEKSKGRQPGDSDEEEDDTPLALKQEDDRPLGQAHPVAVVNQHIQQHQSMMALSQMQMQYQYQMHMQMQMQVAAVHHNGKVPIGKADTMFRVHVYF